MAEPKDGGSSPGEAGARQGQPGTLGATERESGAPANVDVHKLGEPDNPQADWGEAMGEGAVFSSNHARRGEPTEAMRGQGAKTRAANKDIVSRRS